MFQPRGPNLRRSRTEAWKKHSPKSIFLNSFRRAQVSNQLSSTCSREPSRLARMPLAGSMVIFTPFCRTKAGKCGEGSEVSQRRKLGCRVSSENSSQIFSSVGIQLMDRWQFCRHTQVPLSAASWMAFSAMGPCPCPSEMALSLLPKPISSANFISSVMGAAPGVSTNMRGVVHLETSKQPLRSKGGGSMNLLPMLSEMKCCTAGTTTSGRRHRSTHSFLKMS
mmetsp:Transcript_8239/g.18050  ORF Transcript_8239/g.18050 Transcript_8239/m.18050 type:complete len:223 (-) Transcript_8239:9299-9967(-)